MSGRLVIVVIAALLAGACGGSQAEPEPRPQPAPRHARATPRRAPAGPPKTLYVRLGGQPAIEAVVKEFVARLAADVRIKYRFANSDVPQVTAHIIDFVCAASGGPCKYTGRPMRGLHEQMHVTDEEWDAAVEALVGALDKFKVGVAEKHEVLGAVGATRPDIVSPPAEKPSGDELERIDAASRDLKRFGKHAEIMGVAFTALRRGQRSYADQLFSMVELWDGSDAVADLAPLFRTGAPPRVDTPLATMPAESEPQPKGAVGGSDDDDPSAEGRATASLAGRLRLEGEQVEGAFGVVMLTPVKVKGKAARRRIPKHRVVEQRGRAFAPHLMAVPVGSTVAFPNFDPIYHNVFSRSDARPFDLGIFKNGQSREVTFDHEGIVRIGCNLHANMSASIVVVGAPHYAVTDSKGAFTFRRLRPGTYTARAWTERSAEPVTRRIEVKPGANDVLIDAAGGAAPGPSPDKFGAPRGPRR